MKKYRISFLMLMMAVLLNSCLNNDFLEYNPTDRQTEATTFTTYDNFKIYSWGLYSSLFLGGTGDAGLGNIGLGYPGPYDQSGDDAMFASGGKRPWAWQTATVDNVSDWGFGFIRQVNIMLDNIDQSSMSQTDKDHWRAVGYFFRAYRYSQLIARYGDIPWLEHVVKTSDKDIIYGPRTPRDEVASNILNNLLWAEKHIKPAGEGAGTNSINVHVVRALISRFCLAEGTWRKYHKLGDEQRFLDTCIIKSKLVMDAYPNIHSQYDALYNSESLNGVTGILLFRAFSTGQLYHNMSRYERTSEARTEMTKEGVASYLTLNGKPVANVGNQVAVGGQYYGDGNMYNEFRNRDRRLYHTVTPPFRLKSVLPASVVDPKSAYLTTKDTYFGKPVTAADSAMFVEYIELMKTVASTARTTGIQYPPGTTYTILLPTRNWEGNALLAVPHFNKVQEGRGFLVTRGGYSVYKYYNTSTAPNGQTSTNDIPLMRVEETMLNYAEAMWERGGFTQAVADITINKLRPRAGVAPMVVADINASFDPQRDMGGYVDQSPTPIADYEVDPVLWEIRRERRVELMGDGFRFDDLKRWRKGHYLNKVQIGVTIDNKDYDNKFAIWPYDQDEGANPPTASANKVGPVALAGDPVAQGKGWLWYYYLYPVPPTQIVLNPQLVQNPGW